MIITKTPFRISFFGGGTDYPDWYREHGGAVLSTSIDKYCFITCRYLPPFFSHKHRIIYSKIENVSETKDIQHPAVRAVFNWTEINEGLEVHHDGDLPARSGLGSSSAFTVGLTHAIHGLRRQKVDAQTLARNAIHVEQNVIGENVGSQDQIAAAYGGLNRIDFGGEEEFRVSPIALDQERRDDLKNHLLLCFTGISRIADEIAHSKIQNLANRKRELMRMRDIVDEGTSLLSSNTPIEEFGKLLDESWQYKRNLSNKVTTNEIDQLYQAAKDAGAIGGKLLGAGGGGFLLFFAKPEDHDRIKSRLSNLMFVAFGYDDEGSRIIYRESETR